MEATDQIRTLPRLGGGQPRVRLARAATVLAAAVTAAAGWAIAGPLAGVTLAVRLTAAGPVQRVGLTAVLTASLLAGLAGWALLAVLERRAGGARTAWTVIALTTLAVSLAGPLAARSAAAAGVLAGLHLLVGGVLVAGLRRTARR